MVDSIYRTFAKVHPKSLISAIKQARDTWGWWRLFVYGRRLTHFENEARRAIVYKDNVIEIPHRDLDFLLDELIELNIEVTRHTRDVLEVRVEETPGTPVIPQPKPARQDWPVPKSRDPEAYVAHDGTPLPPPPEPPAPPPDRYVRENGPWRADDRWKEGEQEP